MRAVITIAVLLMCAGATAAFDLGTHAGPKPSVSFPPNVPGDRQGGDTILDATPITIPGYDTGTTEGYNHDYEVSCPYGSTSPDVVYTTTPQADVIVDIDLLGSTYDTKVFVYDQDLNVVACNDDFYPDYVSKIEYLELQGGVQYFIVIDGYNGDYGDYVLTVTEYVPCILECPPDAIEEGEPPLVDDYEDAFNGGCNSPEFGNPFGTLVTASDFCGVSGWYLYEGVGRRDTDWFEITVPEEGYIEIIGDAEHETYMFELAPQDCGSVAVVQNVIIGPCQEGTIVIFGDPGSTVWFWVGPTTFDGPVNEYDYVLRVCPCGLPTETRSLSEVKSLFR